MGFCSPRFNRESKPLLSGSLSTEFCISAFLFAKWLVGSIKRSGYLNTALYLKSCSVSLMRFYSGMGVPSRLPYPISLSRDGIPRVIPRFNRELIRRRDERADRIVQLFLSYLKVARLIQMVKRRGDKFKMITSAPSKACNPDAYFDLIGKTFPSVAKRFLSKAMNIPMV